MPPRGAYLNSFISFPVAGMHSSFTPRQIARALAIGESTVKRWCDKGVIPVESTPGGHRRIPTAGLFQFLKDTGRVPVRPELLGMPANLGKGERTLERAAAQLAEAAAAGDEEQARRLIFDLYFAEHDIAVICDRVLAAAFDHIGRQWECGNVEIFQERHACRITARLLDGLRAVAPRPPADAPQAVGGTIAGDHFDLPTQMVELVLLDSGWNAVSLGNNLPFESLAKAVRAYRPQLFWLSCSHLLDEAQFVHDYTAFYDEFADATAIVVGGRALHEGLRKQIKYAAYCDGMQHLTAFAETLLRQ
jgi:excisionase family DNA binding protein